VTDKTIFTGEFIKRSYYGSPPPVVVRECDADVYVNQNSLHTKTGLVSLKIAFFLLCRTGSTEVILYKSA
jgi:hypothetical protein